MLTRQFPPEVYDMVDMTPEAKSNLENKLQTLFPGSGGFEVLNVHDRVDYFEATCVYEDNANKEHRCSVEFTGYIFPTHWEDVKVDGKYI